jgi:hypothetical protein
MDPAQFDLAGIRVDGQAGDGVTQCDRVGVGAGSDRGGTGSDVVALRSLQQRVFDPGKQRSQMR